MLQRGPSHQEDPGPSDPCDARAFSPQPAARRFRHGQELSHPQEEYGVQWHVPAGDSGNTN